MFKRAFLFSLLVLSSLSAMERLDEPQEKKHVLTFEQKVKSLFEDGVLQGDASNEEEMLNVLCGLGGKVSVLEGAVVQSVKKPVSFQIKKDEKLVYPAPDYATYMKLKYWTSEEALLLSRGICPDFYKSNEALIKKNDLELVNSLRNDIGLPGYSNAKPLDSLVSGLAARFISYHDTHQGLVSVETILGKYPMDLVRSIPKKHLKEFCISLFNEYIVIGNSQFDSGNPNWPFKEKSTGKSVYFYAFPKVDPENKREKFVKQNISYSQVFLLDSFYEYIGIN